MRKILTVIPALIILLATTAHAQIKPPAQTTVTPPKKTMLEQAKVQAEADDLTVTKILDAEYNKGKNYDACKVVQLEAEQEYDEWFVKNYAEFEKISSSIDEVINTANAKIGTLNDQSVQVNAVQGQNGEVTVNLEKMVSYFRLFNDRLLTCSKNARSELIDQMESPKRNPLHITHDQVLTAMKTITTNLNASLKEQGVSYEIAFKPAACGYELELRVKLNVNGIKQEYDFSLLDSKSDTELTKIALGEEAKWSALSKSKIDSLPVDGMLRYRIIQDKKKGKCEDLVKIPSYRSGKPFSTYAELLVLAKTLKKEDLSTDMEFVSLDGGTFMMGSPNTEPNRMSNETQHQVTLSSFDLQTTEVTQKQWFDVMGANPSAFKNKEHCPETHTDENGGMCPNNPVEQVSYVDITGPNGFLAKLNAKQDGYTYSLPTEAQWEYAAKAGSSTMYSFGNDETKLKDYGWYDQNAGGHTHEVGKKEKNAFELYDMQGNGWEWVQDWYGDYPTGGAQNNPTGPASGSYRVIRGGGWNGVAQYLRPSYRNVEGPSFRYSGVGFRLMRQPQ